MNKDDCPKIFGGNKMQCKQNTEETIRNRINYLC